MYMNTQERGTMRLFVRICVLCTCVFWCVRIYEQCDDEDVYVYSLHVFFAVAVAFKRKGGWVKEGGICICIYRKKEKQRVYVCECVREREREREKHTETEDERESARARERETEREKQREREKNKKER